MYELCSHSTFVEKMFTEWPVQSIGMILINDSLIVSPFVDGYMMLGIWSSCWDLVFNLKRRKA